MRTKGRVPRSIAIAVAACLLAACATRDGPTWQLPAGVMTLGVNGYPMAYMERGRGPTIVLVHGVVNDYRYWTPQLETLSDRFRVVSVSLRRHYPEPWDGKGAAFSVQSHAEDVARFIEALGAGPVYLVGHSRGGSVAAGAAKLRPELVRKLVLAEPTLFTLLPKPASPPKSDPNIERAKVVFGHFDRGDIDRGLEYYIDSINRPGEWQSRGENDRQILRDNAWTIRGSSVHADIVACEDLRRLPMPVLLVGAEKSGAFFRNVLDGAEKCVANARRVTIPAAAHRMNRENAAAFDRAVASFLEG